MLPTEDPCNRLLMETPQHSSTSSSNDLKAHLLQSFSLSNNSSNNNNAENDSFLSELADREINFANNYTHSSVTELDSSDIDDDAESAQLVGTFERTKVSPVKSPRKALPNVAFVSKSSSNTYDKINTKKHKQPVEDIPQIHKKGDANSSMPSCTNAIDDVTTFNTCEHFQDFDTSICSGSHSASGSDSNCASESVADTSTATVAVDDACPTLPAVASDSDPVNNADSSPVTQAIAGRSNEDQNYTTAVSSSPATTTATTATSSGTTATSRNMEYPELIDYPDHLVCAICLELLFSPFSVKPCSHVFCEPCLRRLARPCPTNTSCPLCREVIGACQPAAGEFTWGNVPYYVVVLQLIYLLFIINVNIAMTQCSHAK